MLQVFARAVRTGTVVSDWIDTDATSIRVLAFFLKIFAAPTGTSPTLVMVIEESVDKDSVVELGRTAVHTAIGTERLRFTEFARYVRVRLELGGTNPSFDCAVTADTD